MRTRRSHAARWALVGLIVGVLLFSAAGATALALGMVAADRWQELSAFVEPGVAGSARGAGSARLLGAQPKSATADAQDLVAAQEQVLNNIYDKVLPSVVHIQVTQQVGLGEDLGIPEFPVPDGFAQGEGSGFVWDERGRIVTNNHVVEGAEDVTVVFVDGTEAAAKVLGTDPSADLAVIEVDVPADLLVPVEAADSSEVQVGQLAVAIGNPFGLENTMTYGIVSAVGRTIPSGTSQFSIPEVIQTDASINPGNSGGPLLDREGRVIGINTQIVSRSGSNSGVGFAVPINIAKRVVPGLIADGEFEYPWLGISGQALSSRLAEAMDLPADTRGALVVGVADGGPAEEAGLLAGADTAEIGGIEVPLGGDAIVEIDGQPVEGMDDLIAYLTDVASPGDRVTLTVLRDGERQEIEAILGTRPGVDELQQMLR